MGDEEQYEVEQVLDERNHGHWKRKQYVVKWKGYPDLDNQWLDAKDMENAQELIAEFHNSNSVLSSHIRRAVEHLSVLYPLSSTLSSTFSSPHMSNASHSTNISTTIEENTAPLPIPPREVATDVPSGPVHLQEQDTTIQERIAGFLQVCEDGSTNIASIHFPHPNEPTSGELNDSDQENIPPSVPTTIHTSPPVQVELLSRMRAAVPFSDHIDSNNALLGAITRVQNNVNRGDTYITQIEEIVQISRALRHRGSPSEDKEAAALVAQLHSIRRLEPDSTPDPTPSPPPTNITFPTPTIPCHTQVTASTMASRARVHTVAHGSALSQPPCTHGSQGSGSQARHLGARVPPIPEGVRVGAELLLTHPSRGAETPPPLGFNFNCGSNYVPCIVTDSRGRGVPARYTRVIMGTNPHVIGIIPRDNSQYGGPLYAIPDHDQGERPWYTQDDFWHFKFGTDDFDRFKSVLKHISDLSLTAEVTCYRETSRLFFQYQEEIQKIETRMWEASQLKDASGCRLEGVNALHRIEEALVDLDRRLRVHHGNTIFTERGCST